MENHNFCIQTKNLCKSFGSKVVLKNLNLNIPKNKISYIVGRSGEGKSVTLKHLVGLLIPDKGEILINGIYMQHADEKLWTKMRIKIGILFQDGALFDSINIFENVAFPLMNHSDKSYDEIKQKVEELLELVKLPGIEEQYSSELSIGERKRVGIARALALDPQIVFYDEPTTNMDPLLSALIDQLILNTQKKIKNLTSVVVSHDIASMMNLADHIFLLHQGKIYFEGNPKDFKDSNDPLVQQFLSGSLKGPLDVPLV